MKILILEDNHERHKAFTRAFIGASVTIVETVEECLLALEQGGYDALFLDHDLGGEEGVASGPGTGYEVACWLERNPDKKPEQIFLHSLNTAGRRNMARALPDAIEMPLAWQKLKIEKLEEPDPAEDIAASTDLCVICKHYKPCCGCGEGTCGVSGKGTRNENVCFTGSFKKLGQGEFLWRERKYEELIGE